MPTKYINPDGSWDRLVGRIDYNKEHEDHEIVVDDKWFTWDELKKNISTYEGWQIIIEFADPSDAIE